MVARPKVPSLDEIRVAAPCPARWDEMEGDERSRFCLQCRLNVYNLSDMSRAEAEKLVREKEGRLCVRFYRRADGTVLTDNCPVGLRAIRKRMALVFGGLAAALTFILWSSRTSARAGGLRTVQPFKTILDWVDPILPPAFTSRRVVLGRIAPIMGTPAPAPMVTIGPVPPPQDDVLEEETGDDNLMNEVDDLEEFPSEE